MKPDWILVANAAQARLLQQEPGSPMIVVQAFHHPERRARSSVGLAKIERRIRQAIA